MQTFINNPVERQKISKGEWLHKLPDELIGILPQNVWTSLSLDQKKEILRQHGLLDKYNNEEVADISVNETIPVTLVETPHGVVNNTLPEIVGNPDLSKEQVPQVVAVDKGLVPEKEAFDKNVEEMKAKEEQMKGERVLSGEEKARIAQEQAAAAQKQDDVKPSVGYKLRSSTVTNAVHISQTGNTDDGRTWAAALVRKIFAIFD